jgi:hypothetical protein
MTDFTSSETHHRRPLRRGAEFYFYFTLIFVLALPFSLGGWVLDVIARKTLNLPGPLARAWTEADRITPLIFSV